MIHGKHHAVALYVLLAAVVVIATVVRIAPLVEGGERLQRQCVSEDGYLMLTIARNMALGKGFSVSDGLVLSNGTQPLAALLYALCFVCSGGDKLQGLYPVVGLQVVISIITAALLFVFTRRQLYRGLRPVMVALLAACIWYASPTLIKHTQNSLETGLYALLILSSIALYDVVAPWLRVGLRLSSCLLLGLLLGITFLGRNDACFLIAVMLIIHVILAYRHHRLRRAFVQALMIGATSVMVALPWLWFNVTRFGHIVPVSGRAEALHVNFAHNLLPAFVAILENALLVLRIPTALEGKGGVIVLSCGFVAAVPILVYMKWRWLTERFSAGMGILACFVGVLFVYYALFFGMPCFLGRYFFPAVMLCAIVGAAVVTAIAAQARRNAHKTLLATVILLAAVACIGLDVRIYTRGREHMHSQIVDWVAANVPEKTWVGAVQTGTLGYYHDRTVNLDGKVDPYALAAREEGRIHEYVIERNVEYIVDWVGIAEWAERPEFAVNYRLLLAETERNLAVLCNHHGEHVDRLIGARQEVQ